MQKFILDNEHSDVGKLVLANKVLFSIPAANISDQIATRRKAKEKLPLYFNTAGIVYPPSANFEQSSSEATARFKSQLVKGLIGDAPSAGADLTGGFGVDTFFFSRLVDHVVYVEPDNSLLELAAHNHRLLGASNIEYHGVTAEDFLRSATQTFGFIFIDPSRRSARGSKLHALADTHPNVLDLLAPVFERTPLLLIKTSPLLDIQAGISQLPYVKSVYVVAVDNECKEVLFICDNRGPGETAIHAVNLSRTMEATEFAFTFAEEKGQQIVHADPDGYLYEPNAAILKAGAFKTVANRFGLRKIARNTHLYTSGDKVMGFPGRSFEIEQFIKGDRREVRSIFPDGKANVTTRNYPLTAAALKQRTGLKDGGDKFLFGFSGESRKFLAVARRF